MANDNTLAKTIIERLIYAVFALLIFGVMFLFKSVSDLNTKIDSVNRNEQSIVKLWQKYGEIHKELHEVKTDVAVIKDRGE